MVAPLTPEQITAEEKAFESWATGRAGFSIDELLEIYLRSRAVAPEVVKTLKEKIAKAKATLVTPKPKAPIPAPPQKKPEVKPTLIIGRTPYPKWWKDLQTAAIDIDDAATEIIILPNPNYFLYIATIVLTVDGETDISFHFGVFGSSGSMNFGADGEPRGISIPMGNSPTSCGTGSFQITSNGVGVHVGGFVSFYREKVKETE